jgi:hypothetical protein
MSIIELNEAQWAAFVAYMENPPPPTPAMIQAGYRHRAMVKARNEGRLTRDGLQAIFAEADREFEAGA